MTQDCPYCARAGVRDTDGRCRGCGAPPERHPMLPDPFSPQGGAGAAAAGGVSIHALYGVRVVSPALVKVTVGPGGGAGSAGGQADRCAGDGAKGRRRT